MRDITSALATYCARSDAGRVRRPLPIAVLLLTPPGALAVALHFLGRRLPQRTRPADETVAVVDTFPESGLFEFIERCRVVAVRVQVSRVPGRY